MASSRERIAARKGIGRSDGEKNHSREKLGGERTYLERSGGHGDTHHLLTSWGMGRKLKPWGGGYGGDIGRTEKEPSKGTAIDGDRVERERESGGMNCLPRGGSGVEWRGKRLLAFGKDSSEGKGLWGGDRTGGDITDLSRALRG